MAKNKTLDPFNPFALDRDTADSLGDFDGKFRAWLLFFRRLWEKRHAFKALPDSIDQDQLLAWLFRKNILLAEVGGKPYFFDYATDKINYLGYPGSVTPIAPNPSSFSNQSFFSRPIPVDTLDSDKAKGVILGVCDLMEPLGGTVSPYRVFSKYATKLALLDMLEEQNIRNNTHPVILTGDGANDANAKIIRERLRSFADCVTVIDTDTAGGLAPNIGTKKGMRDRLRELNVLDLGVSLDTEAIGRAKVDLINESYDYLGIRHLSMEKAERLTNNEVDSGNEATMVYLWRDWDILDKQLARARKLWPNQRFELEKGESSDERIGNDEGAKGKPGDSAGKLGNPVQYGAGSNGADGTRRP